ncbi:hypothetical protein [Paenibacillus radicis (ex Gao et al. 2016)]|uniref:Butirosin biosynthesis protein H N-terminal domain-containing protein n=1 Tax=Paenibacillus radicis (ex Gao et al. 2016) TaxID=1737354 RepID=A0A917MBE3_9BACL|nr:hypothetical protein [Paenibacillus radicis (ex Gao et al. 2016)]GGG89366.1 hypothetical protein GCM10010918_55130 [Paenibacillus radicis (ex Gao et al. 2016)]
MSVNILPVTYPFLTSYTHHTTTLSIITNHEDYMPWFCGNYIQLRVMNDLSSKAWLDFYSYLHKGMHACPFLDIQHMNLDTLRGWGSGIVDFLIKMIDLQNYVYVVVETSQISIYPSYQKRRFAHPIFVYGYDKTEERFYVGDFFKPTFEYSTASFAEVDAAFRAVSADDFGFNGAKIIQYNKKAKFELDLWNVTEMFRDYLYTRDSFGRYRLIQTPDPGEAVGMEHVYTRLIKDVEIHIDNPDLFQHTSFHVLYEHKKAISFILSFLQKQGYIGQNYGYEKVEEKSLMLRNRVLRYVMMKDPALPQQIIGMLHELKELETEALTALVRSLDGGGY